MGHNHRDLLVSVINAVAGYDTIHTGKHGTLEVPPNTTASGETKWYFTNVQDKPVWIETTPCLPDDSDAVGPGERVGGKGWIFSNCCKDERIGFRALSEKPMTLEELAAAHERMREEMKEKRHEPSSDTLKVDPNACITAEDIEKAARDYNAARKWLYGDFPLFNQSHPTSSAFNATWSAPTSHDTQPLFAVLDEAVKNMAAGLNIPDKESFDKSNESLGDFFLFEKAIGLLLDGKHIRRSDWGIGEYICIAEDGAIVDDVNRIYVIEEEDLESLWVVNDLD